MPEENLVNSSSKSNTHNPFRLQEKLFIVAYGCCSFCKITRGIWQSRSWPIGLWMGMQ